MHGGGAYASLYPGEIFGSAHVPVAALALTVVPILRNDLIHFSGGIFWQGKFIYHNANDFCSPRKKINEFDVYKYVLKFSVHEFDTISWYNNSKDRFLPVVSNSL